MANLYCKQLSDHTVLHLNSCSSGIINWINKSILMCFLVQRNSNFHSFLVIKHKMLNKSGQILDGVKYNVV